MNTKTALCACHIVHSLTDMTCVAERVSHAEYRLTALIYGIVPSYRGFALPVSDNPFFRRVTKLLSGFLDNTTQDLTGIPLCFEGYTVFAQQVLAAARRIPWGSVVSYTELARMSGNPKAVRAAANVMRHNPFPPVVPCHRVIRSNGTIGGFGGSISGDAINLKKKLLAREGKGKS